MSQTVKIPVTLWRSWGGVCRLFGILLLPLLASCAVVAPGPDGGSDAVLYQMEGEPGFATYARYGPLFMVDGPDLSHNRIGRASARFDGQGREDIFIDPADSVVYVDRQRFRTERAEYVNYLYRIHFPETPFSLFPFHLTAGKNGGFIVVVTVNDGGDPVLLTTVHTCGCYLAFFPTSYLPADALPLKWDNEAQQVFGYRLPGRLDFGAAPGDTFRRPLLFLTSATHRLRDIQVSSDRAVIVGPVANNLEIRPMADLERLPVGEGFTSFFETTGPGKGFVKNSAKPWERLFMSWWTLDWRIGQDKALGPWRETGTVFYTSIKFWQRRQSDMWPFADFLRYWGWRL